MSQKFESATLTDRLPKLIGAPPNAAGILRNLRVLAIGAGSIGSRIELHLARWNVARLGIVDPASFKPQSLLTHDIGPDAIGRPKAEWTAAACRRISPTSRIEWRQSPIQHLSPSEFTEFDLVALSSDNLRCETAAGQVCQWLGLPLVQGSVQGETLTAQVRFFANGDADSPCPSCQFSEDEWRSHDEELVYACSGGTAMQKVQPTMSTSFLCSIAADLTMTQIMRHVLGLGRPVADTLLSWCGYTHRSFISPLERRSTCRLEHARWQRVTVARPLAQFTPEELLAAAGMDDAPRGEQIMLAIDGHRFAERAWCCGEEQTIGRFVSAGDACGSCVCCGRPLVPPPFFLREDVALKQIAASHDLSRWGVKTPRGVRLAAGSRTVLITAREETP